jgi:LysR family hydrogen peroxide-inducible transcriptional activator
LEHELGVILFERNNRRVNITPVGEQVLEHARRAIEEANLAAAVAKASKDQLAGPLRLGVIPTLAPYLMPLILGPLRAAYPQLTLELWEDLTIPILDRLRAQRLDAALIAGNVGQPDVTSIALFEEPFLAALPKGHRFAETSTVPETELLDELLVLSDGHCLAGQARAAWSRTRGRRNPVSPESDFRAASLETLANLVAAGYGVTLAPQLAARSLERFGVILRPLQGKPSRTIHLASRPTFTRPKALQALARTIRTGVAPFLDLR